jgi:hypothetical protein
MRGRQLSLVQNDGTRSVLPGEYAIALDPGTSEAPTKIIKPSRIHRISALPR